jgi:agmatinase
MRHPLKRRLAIADPVIPAVAGPAPGGVTFHQARKLIHGLVNKGRVVGMDIVEITPRLDVNRITCITAGRLIVNLIGAAVRAGYFEAA